jgi:hypothetical protein
MVRSGALSGSRVVIALGLTLIVACGAGPHRPPPSPTPPAPAASDAWSTLTWEERHDTMTFTVLPNMARLFQRFKGTDAPTMTCTTCHGTDAEEARYAMPRGLPALDPKHMPTADDSDPRRARMAKFMIDEVTPTMADLLDTPRYDPRTGRGFSCFRCHPARP